MRLPEDIAVADNLIADCEEDIPDIPQDVRLNPEAPWYSYRSCPDCKLYMRYYLKHLKVAEAPIRDRGGAFLVRVNQGVPYVECPRCASAVPIGNDKYLGAVKEYTREDRELHRPW